MIASQNMKILNHMQRIGGITQWEAIMGYRITRLSARIKDLKDMGNGIIDTWETSTNEQGETKRYKRYFVVK